MRTGKVKPWLNEEKRKKAGREELKGKEERREQEGSDGHFSVDQKTEDIADCGYNVFKMNIERTRNHCDA